MQSTPEELDGYCAKADFVFNLAGVNRPENPEDFMKGNFGFASDLLNCLKKHNNKATIMLSSSVQATLAGRVRQLRVWPEQESGGGAVLRVRQGNRGKSGRLSLRQPHGPQPPQV